MILYRYQRTELHTSIQIIAFIGLSSLNGKFCYASKLFIELQVSFFNLGLKTVPAQSTGFPL